MMAPSSKTVPTGEFPTAIDVPSAGVQATDPPPTAQQLYMTGGTKLITPPFPLDEIYPSSTLPNQIGPYHHRPYHTEQAVHTITFKIFTRNGNRRELWVNEINNHGFSRMREPEHFFSQLTSSSAMAHSFTDWRQYYNLPTGHAGSPFSDFSQNQAPLSTTPTTSSVPQRATQLTNLARQVRVQHPQPT